MSTWIETAAGVYAIGKELKLWKRLKSRLRRKKKVLILGASGVGKTQFINSIEDVLSEKLTVRHRTGSLQTRKATIDEYPFLLIDTPGQKFDEGKRKKAINAVIRDGVEGIVNVVCYGFHEAREADSIDAVPERGNKVARTPYLRQRRAAELDLLSEWVPRIDSDTANWILTVVTKADLWWPDEDDNIKDYYEQGDYAETLGHLRDIQTVMPYCSTIEPFFGRRTSGRFGDRERDALRGHLLESLLRLTGVVR